MGPWLILLPLVAGVAYWLRNARNAPVTLPIQPSAMDYAAADTVTTPPQQPPQQPTGMPAGGGGGIVPGPSPIVVLASRLEQNLIQLGDAYDHNLCSQFQRAAGITADGLYGPQSVAALSKVLGHPAPPAAKNRHS